MSGASSSVWQNPSGRVLIGRLNDDTDKNLLWFDQVLLTATLRAGLSPTVGLQPLELKVELTPSQLLSTQNDNLPNMFFWLIILDAVSYW